MWWGGKLSLCDQRIYDSTDCTIPTTRGLHIVTDERTPVLVVNRLKNVKALRYYVSHTTIIYRPLPSAVLLRKLTNNTSRKRGKMVYMYTKISKALAAQATQV